MIEVVIGENEAGQRFDKYLGKLLHHAPSGFYYKMLRKKNITLNGKKAEGKEKLAEGDMVRLYLAPETYERFSGKKAGTEENEERDCKQTVDKLLQLSIPDELTVIYEDKHILLWNKPVNMLSQKAKDEDISLNEYFLAYLLQSGQLAPKELHTFKPSVCNRLDRNTSEYSYMRQDPSRASENERTFKNERTGKILCMRDKGQLKRADFLKGIFEKRFCFQ